MSRNKANNNVWKHFQKLERKPGTHYFYARCKFCDEDGSLPLEGRVRTLKNHLKGCKPFIEYLEQEKACSSGSSTTTCTPGGNDSCSISISSSKRSCSALTSSNLKKLKSTSVLGFMDCALTLKKEDLLNCRIIKIISDNAMSFNWIERLSTRCFFEALRPAAVQCMPSR